MILPPPDIRIIIEKLAAYVIKNGSSFEDKIKEKERQNLRFTFLYPHDPYHSFYQHRLEEYSKVGPDGVDELLATNTAHGKRGNETRGTIISSSHKQLAPQPKEPLPLDFLISLPPISLLDYDVIKLTAQYVARNGRQFMFSLRQREVSNPQLDFLNPAHSFHPIFLCLVDQYMKVFLPPRELLSKLKLYRDEKFKVLFAVMSRVEYVRFCQNQKNELEKKEEEERIKSASIDWNDFLIVETIDFSIADKYMDLPAPLEYTALLGMSIMQRKELWSGGAWKDVQTHTTEETREEEMEVDGASNEGRFKDPITVAIPSITPQPLPYENIGNSINIRQDYVPRAAQATSVAEQSEICPICQQPVPKSQIEAHMRIESLDPKWKEQRERYLAKHKESNIVISGEDVSRNLQAMKRVKTELASLAEQEAARKISEANRQAFDSSVQWDGKGDTVFQATKEAMKKAKQQLAAEMSLLQQSGDLSLDPNSNIGPKMDGK